MREGIILETPGTHSPQEGQKDVLSTNKSESLMLWEDVINLLKDDDYLPSVIAMLENCGVGEVKDNKLTVYTSLKFAYRKLEDNHYLVENYLEEAAFEHIDLSFKLTSIEECSKYPCLAATNSASYSKAPEEEQEKNEDAARTYTQAEHTNATSNALSSQNNQKKLISVQTKMTADDFSALDDTLHDEFDDAQERIRLHGGFMNTRPTFSMLPETENMIDSKLTFDRFVQGEENMLAYQAAMQVACGTGSQSYNPLFIYGKSGLGKTHLLRAIQNYIIKNDESRRCVYKTATEFIEEYTLAWQKSPEDRNALARRYKNIDVLIIDDIQNMRTAAGTIKFFFDTFNALISSGKQIVCAADRSPQELQMGESKFDERETSRMDSGITISIQVPNYELKLNLINNFYKDIKADAEKEHMAGNFGTITEEQRQYMAKIAGSNIRVIEGFVQTCLINAGKHEHEGHHISLNDIKCIASSKWNIHQQAPTIEAIQKAVEEAYNITHEDLIGNKRGKEFMEPRHICIWLIREMTDITLADIGDKFGHRTHATIKHSISWVEARKKDRVMYDQLRRLQDALRTQEL